MTADNPNCDIGTSRRGKDAEVSQSKGWYSIDTRRSKAAIVFWVSSGVAPDGRKAERQRVYDMVCGKEIERLDNRISVQRRFKLA